MLYNKRPFRYETQEFWFPGILLFQYKGEHPDLGRQKLIYPGTFDLITSLLHFANRVFDVIVVEPNYEYSLNVLKWMRQNLLKHNPDILDKVFFAKHYAVAQKQNKPWFYRRALSFLIPPSPITSNVYDTLFNYVRPIIGPISNTFLGDRLIYPDREAFFYKIEENFDQFLSNPNGGNISKTYDTYLFEHVH